MSGVVGRAYDAIADTYDEQVRGDDWMRRVLHAHYLRLFAAGDRVLDVGCGTGIDALFLARHGVRVVGIDASPGAIDQLRSKLARAGLTDLVEARVLEIEALSELGDNRFDGLISAFAALNSVADLQRFSEDAARLIRPGGRVVLHMLNRFSLWEWLGYAMRGDVHAASRVGRLRIRQFTIGGHPIEHTLYFADEVYRAVFKRRFILRRRYGVGAVRPPHTVRRLPRRVVEALERLDTRSGTWPLLSDAGRFFVLELERAQHEDGTRHA